MQVVYAVSLLPASIGVSSMMGQVAGFATFFAGAGLGVLAFGASAARRLLSQGFARADLTQAFAAELANSRDERAADYSRGATMLEALTGNLARILGTFSAVAIPITLTALITTDYDPLVRTAAAVVQAIGEATAVFGISYLALRQLRRDVDTEFWNSVWTGKIGEFFFSVAKRFSRGMPVASSMTHRATELSLGMAADQLYEGLPKATQQELRELPGVLRRLQHDAQGLRQRLDQLQEAITDAGAAANSPEYESVRQARDLTSSKLGEAVGALETIRLNLLRLHAGSATVEGLTTHLGIAADVSEEIDRLIAAQDEMESHLRFPSEAEPTPV
jgi:serine/threonine-protein kinase